MVKVWTRIKLADGRASEGYADDPPMTAQTIAGNTGLIVSYATATAKRGTFTAWIDVYPQGSFSWSPPGHLSREM